METIDEICNEINNFESATKFKIMVNVGKNRGYLTYCKLNRFEYRINNFLIKQLIKKYSKHLVNVYYYFDKDVSKFPVIYLTYKTHE